MILGPHCHSWGEEWTQIRITTFSSETKGQLWGRWKNVSVVCSSYHVAGTVLKVLFSCLLMTVRCGLGSHRAGIWTHLLNCRGWILTFSALLLQHTSLAIPVAPPLLQLMHAHAQGTFSRVWFLCWKSGTLSVEEPQQVSLVSPKWDPGHTCGQEWER